MKIRNILFSVTLLAAFLVTACGTSTGDDMVTEEPHGAMATEDTMHGDMMTEDAPMNDGSMTNDAMMETPNWFSASLTNVHTGEDFAIQDLQGKVVLVETMAVWCSNCLKQQGQVKELHNLLGERDDFVSLGLDIDPNEDAAKLKGFVEDKGFDWLYAVSPADVSREFASLYGDQFLNPPSTPMLVIDRHGNVHPLPFGIKSADDLLNAVQPYLDEEM